MKAELARLEQLRGRIHKLIKHTSPVWLMVSRGTRWIGNASEFEPPTKAMLPVTWQQPWGWRNGQAQRGTFREYVGWIVARSQSSLDAWLGVANSIGQLISGLEAPAVPGSFGTWVATLRDRPVVMPEWLALICLAEASADGFGVGKAGVSRCMQVMCRGCRLTVPQRDGSYSHAADRLETIAGIGDLEALRAEYFIEAIEDVGRSFDHALDSVIAAARAVHQSNVDLIPSTLGDKSSAQAALTSQQAAVDSSTARRSERSKSQDSTRKKRGSNTSYARSKAKPGRDKSQSHPRRKRITLSDRDKNIMIALSDHKMIGREVANPPDHATLAKWAGYAPNSHFKRALANLVKRKYLDNGRRHREQGGYWLTPKGVRAAQRANS